MELDVKWVHMVRYELILKLHGALWLTIISKPLLTPKGAMERPNILKESLNKLKTIFNGQASQENRRAATGRTHRSDKQYLPFKKLSKNPQEDPIREIRTFGKPSKLVQLGGVLPWRKNNLFVDF